MPNNAHKKRAKGSWCQGKGYKGDSEERMYAKKEIVEEVKASDDDYLTRHKSKRKKNAKAKLEYWISWYSQTIEKHEKNGTLNFLTSSFKDSLKKLKKEYEEKYSNKKK